MEVVVDLVPMQEMEGVVVTIGEGEVDFPTIHLIEVALVKVEEARLLQAEEMMTMMVIFDFFAISSLQSSDNSLPSIDMDGPTLVPSSNPNSSRSIATRQPVSRSNATAPIPQYASSTNSTGIKCQCDIPAGERTVVKEGANKGRKFWKCGNGDQCNFFEWMDGPSQQKSSAISSGPPRSAVGQNSVRSYSRSTSLVVSSFTDNLTSTYYLVYKISTLIQRSCVTAVVIITQRQNPRRSSANAT